VNSPEAIAAARARRILIVDDDLSIRYLLSRILIDEGYEAVSAANGEEGLQAAKSLEVDLVLLDLNMAGLSGKETLTRLKRERPRLPVIIITASPLQQVRKELTAAAMAFQKPLDFPQLLGSIKNVLTDLAAENGSSALARKE
jgi:CheY-like chemotaxis protein